eukprot:Nitzschia sp. Nitz4//scaffold100_size80364//67585//68541//NITZ4_005349-RA/size80364-processed-gene-0.37-mRNA-1//1//CDS//3329532109//4224//frame0
MAWQREARRAQCTEGEMSFVCPYCRTPLTSDEGDAEPSLWDHLFDLARDSSSNPPEVNERLLAQFEVLLENPSSAMLDTYMFKANVLIALGKGTEAVETLDDMLAEYGRRRDLEEMLPMLHLIIQAEQASAQGDSHVLENAKRRLQAAYEEMSGRRRQILNWKDMADMVVLKGEAYVASQEWGKALHEYSELNSTLHGIPPVSFMHRVIATRKEEIPTPLVQKVITGIARCLYHLGEYNRAIEMSQMLMIAYRHCPNVHKYKALSEKAQGNLDAAVQTMNQAVLYEAPWDDQHMKEVQTLYYELLAERDAVRHEHQEA